MNVHPRRGRECGPCGVYTMMCLAFVCGECGHYLNVPRCLTSEVRKLKDVGVHIRSAHCLRWGNGGYIKVLEDSVPLMEALGYEHIGPLFYGNGRVERCCFIPKTEMPTDDEPELYEEWIADGSRSSRAQLGENDEGWQR